MRRCPEAGKAPMKIPVGLGSQRDLLGHFRGTRSLVRRGREAKPSLCSWNWLLKLWRLFGTRERGECETGCPYLCGKVIPQLVTPADLLVINPKMPWRGRSSGKRAWIWWCRNSRGLEQLCSERGKGAVSCRESSGGVWEFALQVGMKVAPPCK